MLFFVHYPVFIHELEISTWIKEASQQANYQYHSTCFRMQKQEC